MIAAIDLVLQHELRTRSYRSGRSVCFVTDGPKPREVFAASFRDRIVHHLLVSHQERIFEPRFIHDPYACRRGKGTLAASDRAMQLLRQVSANGRQRAFAVKLDVAGFFGSIHKETLFELLTRRVRDPKLVWLTGVVLFHDPTENYVFRSKGREIPPPGSPDYPIRPEKSLFGKQNLRGLPIGNLTSQFWANVYLNEVDQFVKRTLRVRHYVRYVDDMLLLSQCRSELLAWRDQIAELLDRSLRLRLRPEPAEFVPVGRGVDFVGWKTWGRRRVVRHRTLQSFGERVGSFEKQWVRRALGGAAHRIDLDRPGAHEAAVGLVRVLASYSGHLRNGAACDWRKAWRERPWLAALFERRGWNLAPRWPQPRPWQPLGPRAHYAALIRSAAGRCLVFTRVGRFVEFYGPQRIKAHAVFGLRPVALPRARGLAAGFPVASIGVFRRCAFEAGRAVAEVITSPPTGGPSVPCFAVIRLWIPAEPR